MQPRAAKDIHSGEHPSIGPAAQAEQLHNAGETVQHRIWKSTLGVLQLVHL